MKRVAIRKSATSEDSRCEELMQMKKAKTKTTSLIPVQRKTQTEGSDRENQTAENAHLLEDDLNPPMAWTSIKLNFGLSLPYVVIEHLFDTDEGLAWGRRTVSGEIDAERSRRHRHVFARDYSLGAENP
jgi:hypothetical protein